MTTHLEKSTIKFLKDLNKNNNREWFKENKPRYQEAIVNVKELLQSIANEMSKVDEIESQKVYRIYRDVRFSKDKTPYKNYFGISLTRATKARRGGYFLGIQLGGESKIAGGFWNPDSKDLKRVRDEIAINDKDFRRIINSKKFKDNFEELEGDRLKRIPRGFDKEHKSEDLLRLKQYLCYRSISDKELMEPDFLKKIVSSYKAMRPFFDWMSDTLTTNINGESLID